MAEVYVVTHTCMPRQFALQLMRLDADLNVPHESIPETVTIKVTR